MRVGGNERGSVGKRPRSGLREALSILDGIADCIVIVDEAGTVIDINAARQRALDTSAGAAIGQPLARLLPSLAPLPPHELLERSIAQGGLDADIRCRDGKRIPVHVTISKSTTDTVARYALAIRDFRAMQQAQSRLLETERLAALGETTTALAHESRNALQRLHACLTLLRLRCDAHVQDLVDDMDDALDQLQRLYEEFRTYAAPLQLKLRRVNLERVLDKTWLQLKVQWEPKRLRFTVRRGADVDVTLRMDPTRIGQVFRNVIENAIQASPDDAEIVAVLDYADKTNTAISVVIEDHGPGVSPVIQAHAFDLLYTTKPDGTGMGLVIAQRIVREHRGQISLEDSESGARVRIVLPRTESGAAP